MKKWVLILLMLLLTLPGYALITIEKKPGSGTLAGHLDDINANDLELDGKISDKVSDDAFTSDWSTVTDVAPSQAALYNYLINFDTDGDGLFSDEAWFPAIFDPAVPGEIGGTTAAAGTFTDLTAGTLTLTPTDGENRLTFPENTSRTPATGAEEIFNEGGLMKYSENGVKKSFVTIDDTAGDGDTTVTLSADKIVELILSGGSGVPDGTDTNDILSWDGDSWEPIALEDHPAFSSLLAAFNAAGLNSFTFTPSVTYPIWANTSPVTISFDVTDTSSTYAVSDVDYQYDGTGGFVSNMTNTTGDTWTADVAIATDGAHTIQFEATDDKAGTPNTGQSAVYTINFDATDPGVGTVTPNPATHNGTGTAIEVTIASITEANEASRQYRIYDVTDAAVEESYQSFSGLTINETLPADQHTYRFDILVTDLAGNTGTASSANIAYSAGAVNPDYQWNLDDNAASKTVLASYGGVNGTYYVNGVATNTSTVHDVTYGIIKNPNSGDISVSGGIISSVLSDGTGAIRLTIRGSGGSQNATYAYLVAEGNGVFYIRRTSVSTTIRISISGTNYDATVDNIEDGNEHKLMFVFDSSASSGKLRVYQSTSGSTYSLKYSSDTLLTPSGLGSTTHFYNQSSSGTAAWGSSTNNYYAGKIELWNDAVTP